MRILVVDDDSLVLRTTARVLRRHGHEVLEAASAVAALALLGQHAVDLLVSDVVMPGMDGIGLLQQLEDRYPGLPVLVISGGGDNANSEFQRLTDFQNVGAVMRKPFDMEDLVRQVVEMAR